jgi:hypothetical protein
MSGWPIRTTLAELEQLRDVNQTIAEKNRGLEDYVATLEAAIKAKPQPAQRRAKAGV